MEELLEILGELRPDVDFENETALITDGILDSFDIVALVGELNDAFDIENKSFLFGKEAFVLNLLRAALRKSGRIPKSSGVACVIYGDIYE